LAASPGAAVVAAGPGVVTYAGTLAGRGVVTVTHGTLRTTYEPVRATVATGDRVHAGQQIGVLDGAGHCASQACLHWGLLRGDTYLNPLSLLSRGPSRLLPVWPFRGG
jgi:murein DD-endopeptidase MepM/ murein hydrolase activator NlpD